ncbi:MAG: hypothetical protein SNG14_03830 [Rikenellaceae bacterium]
MLRRLILFIAAAVVATSCGGDEYVAPTFPEGTIPVVEITGVTAADTGVFAATDGISTTQSFNIEVKAEGTIFPDCTTANSSITIDDEVGDFILSYATGASTFSISTSGENETSSELSALISVIVDSSFGGSVSTMFVYQSPADIPHFTTQPRDITFSGTVSVGSVAYTTFVIDPAQVTDINLDSFTITSSAYFETLLTETAGVDNGYTITFTATQAAVNALSSSEDDIIVDCTVTLTYGDAGATEVSDTFTVTLSD